MKHKKGSKVSVIMNVHNGEKFIKESIQSVIEQTFENWELIIWDNQSTDKTFFILSQFKDKRIKYFKSNKFDKLYAARNKAIEKSSGELITFLDVDDLWLPNKLSSQIKIMSNLEIDFCFSNYYLISEKGLDIFSKKAFKKLPSGKIYKKLIDFYNVGILTLCIRKKIIIKYKLIFDPRFSIIGDMLYVFELSKKGIAYGEQNCLACYRSHDSNLSKRKVLLQVREMRMWFKDLKSLGKWNRKELYNLVSLTNYQRAKGLSEKLSLYQLFKVTFKIKRLSLIFRFLCFYFLKVFPNKIYSFKLKKLFHRTFFK